MKLPQADFPAAAHGPHPPPDRRDGRWSWQRWLTFVALAFAAQVALIFALGGRQLPPPRAATNVIRLTLADGSSELLALNDPTLLALPRTNDFPSTAWDRMPGAPPPSFPRKEQSLPSLLATDKLGEAFTQFMRTNVFAPQTNSFKPEPRLSEPVLVAPPAFPENSSRRIEGGLAGRTLLSPVSLTNWPYADVIPPSQVQVGVDAAGDVFSAVLLPLDNPGEGAGLHSYDAADQFALELARQLRFAPAPGPAEGRLIFNWRTVPPPASPPPVAPP